MQLNRVKLDHLRSEVEGDAELQTPVLAPLGVYTFDAYKSGIVGTRYGYTRYQAGGSSPGAGGPHVMIFHFAFNQLARPWGRFLRMQIQPSSAAHTAIFQALPACDIRVLAAPANHDGDAELGALDLDVGGSSLDVGTITEGFSEGDCRRPPFGGDTPEFQRLVVAQATAVTVLDVDVPLLKQRIPDNDLFRSLDVFVRFNAVPNSQNRGAYIHTVYSSGEQRWPES